MHLLITMQCNVISCCSLLLLLLLLIGTSQPGPETQQPGTCPETHEHQGWSRWGTWRPWPQGCCGRESVKRRKWHRCYIYAPIKHKGILCMDVTDGSVVCLETSQRPKFEEHFLYISRYYLWITLALHLEVTRVHTQSEGMQLTEFLETFFQVIDFGHSVSNSHHHSYSVLPGSSRVGALVLPVGEVSLGLWVHHQHPGSNQNKC